MSGPLAGVKVIELAFAVAGPLVGRYLADFGATVVRVESAERLDISRANPPFKENRPGINRSVFHAQYNSGKLSLGLNIQSEQGRSLLRRLASWADVIVDVFSPDTLERWGLDPAQLLAENPNLIVVRCSAHGGTGPHASLREFGFTLAAAAGIHHFAGWPDRSPVEAYGAYTDLLVPKFVVPAILAHLLAPEPRGAVIECSQREITLQAIGPALLRAHAGSEPTRHGNEAPGLAPHDVYRCAGEDRWCAIAVTDDEAWQRLCHMIARPDLAADPLLATADGRTASADAIRVAIEQWTTKLDARTAADRLQRAGVAACEVANIADCIGDPQLGTYRTFERVAHAEIGAYLWERLAIHLEDYEAPARPGPCLGEHTELICKEILGLSDEELAELLAMEVLE